MRARNRQIAFPRLIAALLGFAIPAIAMAQQPPALERRAEAIQLVVGGRPFLILGDETHQSRHVRRLPRGPSLQRVWLYRHR